MCQRARIRDPACEHLKGWKDLVRFHAYLAQELVTWFGVHGRVGAEASVSVMSRDVCLKGTSTKPTPAHVTLFKQTILSQSGPLGPSAVWIPVWLGAEDVLAKSGPQHSTEVVEGVGERESQRNSEGVTTKRRSLLSPVQRSVGGRHRALFSRGQVIDWCLGLQQLALCIEEMLTERQGYPAFLTVVACASGGSKFRAPIDWAARLDVVSARDLRLLPPSTALPPSRDRPARTRGLPMNPPSPGSVSLHVLMHSYSQAYSRLKFISYSHLEALTTCHSTTLDAMRTGASGILTALTTCHSTTLGATRTGAVVYSEQYEAYCSLYTHGTSSNLLVNNLRCRANDPVEVVDYYFKRISLSNKVSLLGLTVMSTVLGLYPDDLLISHLAYCLAYWVLLPLAHQAPYSARPQSLLPVNLTPGGNATTGSCGHLAGNGTDISGINIPTNGIHPNGAAKQFPKFRQLQTIRGTVPSRQVANIPLVTLYETLAETASMGWPHSQQPWSYRWRNCQQRGYG
ncbi:hypothetical protein JB92DRAFT_2827182 [Gautieria morchelliformis]|nr:hypothetical protein JB92DRAFT_2827182 [Gautieria morchelliformis]